MKTLKLKATSTKKDRDLMEKEGLEKSGSSFLTLQTMVDNKKWHEIGNKLTFHLKICRCQRKVKSIVEVLFNIYNKIQASEEDTLTAEEQLICALLDSHTFTLTHGTNMEHLIPRDEEFWAWLMIVRGDPNLEDK